MPHLGPWVFDWGLVRSTGDILYGTGVVIVKGVSCCALRGLSRLRRRGSLARAGCPCYARAGCPRHGARAGCPCYARAGRPRDARAGCPRHGDALATVHGREACGAGLGVAEVIRGKYVILQFWAVFSALGQYFPYVCRELGDQGLRARGSLAWVLAGLAGRRVARFLRRPCFQARRPRLKWACR